MNDVDAARMLGWASIGIGLTEIAAPHLVERQLGVGDHAALLRTMGMREIASGLTILSQDEPNATMAAGLWSRVMGDAVDLALLGAAATRTYNPGGLAVAAAMVLGITALDVLYAQRLQSRRGGDAQQPYLPFDEPGEMETSFESRARIALPM